MYSNMQVYAYMEVFASASAGALPETPKSHEETRKNIYIYIGRPLLVEPHLHLHCVDSAAHRTRTTLRTYIRGHRLTPPHPPPNPYRRDACLTRSMRAFRSTSHSSSAPFLEPFPPPPPVFQLPLLALMLALPLLLSASFPSKFPMRDSTLEDDDDVDPEDAAAAAKLPPSVFEKNRKKNAENDLHAHCGVG